MPIFDQVKWTKGPLRSPDLAESGTIRFPVLELVRVQIFVALAYKVFVLFTFRGESYMRF